MVRCLSIISLLVLTLSFGALYGTEMVNDSSALTLQDKNDTTFNVSSDLVPSIESLHYVTMLFLKYGDENVLSKEQLHEMLKDLGLKTIIEEDQHEGHGDDSHGGHDDHSNEGHDDNSHGGHDDHAHGGHGGHDDHAHEENQLSRRRRSVNTQLNHSDHENCLKFSTLLQTFHLEANHHLTKEDFTYLCPALIEQLTNNQCASFNLNNELDKVVPLNLSEIPLKVWGYSTIAVLIISLAGLLGVAVIPIMQKVFYNHLLQFLVALAIGALSGDALLHLLPHAIAGTIETHSHENDNSGAHRAIAWKGLMALAGILFFFITERLLTILTSIKQRKKSKKLKKKKQCAKYCDVESHHTEGIAGKLSGDHGNEDNCDKMVMLVHPNKDEPGNGTALKSLADTTHDEFLHQCDEEANMMVDDKKAMDDESDIKLMERSNNGVIEGQSNAGHSHGHGHGHGSVPNSVAAVAWMVILGDGIHNFSDGLAIGASFANSITGGFSTSIAVFCHELPHEIGDFAVLLRAGMSPKQAALYNCLSSILCFIGMLVGVSIGNITSASLWVFAIVGGMFLYIALVDMLPEMTTVDPKKGENPFLHLLLQVCGILLGSSIMLMIALYEDDIKKSFD